MNHVRLWILLAVVSVAFVTSGADALAQDAAREQLASLGCAACHDDLLAAGQRAAPDLRMTVPLMNAPFLEAFLTAPHSVQPGTRMPEMLSGVAMADRGNAAAELSAFLREVAGPSVAASSRGSAERGQLIFHDIGCVLCHGPRVPIEGATRIPLAPAGARSLEHIADKYTADGLAAFLLEPLRHRSAGLMPDMHLNRAEAADLAAYLAPASSMASPSAANKSLASAGRERFHELRCDRCHTGVVEPRSADVVPDIGNTTEGCLADDPAPGLPRYELTAGARDGLRRAIANLESPMSAADRIEASLSAFRCTSCHVRGDLGGVPVALDGYLVTDQPDLGEQARRPPLLTGVGGKLRRAWLERVLFDGASVRPYMHTRMPIFGAANIAHLPALLEEVDAELPLELAEPMADDERATRDAAQKMLGITGLGCVMCHTFNGKPAPSFQGLDLITSPERLRERWFHDFLISPQSKLPGIVMPEAWPGGVAMLDDVLDGSTERQVAVVWHFLKLGTSAPDPRGIHQPRWDVDVGAVPRVYRGRSRVAGFRGIAVGFPEGLHYAFDANDGALAAVWRGDFVSVNWNGQGAGDFQPRSKAAELPRDVAWLERIGASAAWPLRPITTEEAPVNADPAYPRQHGYRFRGYWLDADGVPTLRYALHDVAIEDLITPVPRNGRTVLSRRVTLKSAAPARLSFRVLAGAIVPLDDGRFECGGLIVDISGAESRTRAFSDGQELLIDLDLPTGLTNLELSYDLAD